MGAYYVGLDVHSREAVFVIEDEAGTVVGREAMPTTLEGPRAVVPLPPTLGGDGRGAGAGTAAFYVARALVELHLNPVVIDAHEVRIKDQSASPRPEE